MVFSIVPIFIEPQITGGNLLHFAPPIKQNKQTNKQTCNDPIRFFYFYCQNPKVTGSGQLNPCMAPLSGTVKRVCVCVCIPGNMS